MLQVLYGISQGLYWMTYCSTLGFASSYITAMGYSATQLGIMLATANIIAAPVQQIVANAADKAKKITLAKIMIIWLAILTIANLVMVYLKQGSVILPVCFVLSSVIIMLVQPLENALAFNIERTGKSVNFGLCRSIGSMMFSVVSSFIGWLAARNGAVVIPQIAMIFGFCYVIVLVIVDIATNKQRLAGKVETSQDEPGIVNVSEATLKDYIEKYKFFFLFLLGTIAFTFGHLLINNYLFQVTSEVGGDSADMGKLLSVQAVVELPPMALFSVISKKIKTTKLLKVAAIFFTVKTFFTFAAGTLPMLYISMLLQMLAFAIYIPAAVSFVNDIMDEKDAVKGQSFVTVAYTISAALACSLGGVFIDNLGVKNTLLACVGLGVIGTVASILALNKYEKK